MGHASLPDNRDPSWYMECSITSSALYLQGSFVKRPVLLPPPCRSGFPAGVLQAVATPAVSMLAGRSHVLHSTASAPKPITSSVHLCSPPLIGRPSLVGGDRRSCPPPALHVPGPPGAAAWLASPPPRQPPLPAADAPPCFALQHIARAAMNQGRKTGKKRASTPKRKAEAQTAPPPAKSVTKPEPEALPIPTLELVTGGFRACSPLATARPPPVCSATGTAKAVAATSAPCHAGSPSPLGTWPTEGGVNFALLAPAATSVVLCLFDEENKALGEFALAKQQGRATFYVRWAAYALRRAQGIAVGLETARGWGEGGCCEQRLAAHAALPHAHSSQMGHGLEPSRACRRGAFCMGTRSTATRATRRSGGGIRAECCWTPMPNWSRGVAGLESVTPLSSLRRWCVAGVGGW